MKIINYTFTNSTSLNNFIRENNIQNSNQTFIQMFYSEISDTNLCLEVRDCIKQLLPNAMIMGTSTDGNVASGRVEDNCIILSFSLFENSFANTFIFNDTSIFEIVMYLKKHVIKENTKLLVLFANIFTFNANNLINELNKYLKGVVICGGYAGINFESNSSLVITNDNDDAQLVVTSIESDCLNVSTNYFLNWQTIGKKMIVTKSKKNIIYEIDNKKAIDIYEYYLGKDVVDGFPETGLDFPLIFMDNDIKAARVPVSLGKDGSVVLSGNIDKGSEVKFSFANIEYIEENNLNLLKERKHSISEAIYVYSCVARKKIFAEYLNDELSLLNHIAQTTGFMTYGEFYHNQDNQINTLLNTTTTYVTLSEHKYEEFKFDEHEIKYNDKQKNSLTLKALSHLVDRTSLDLEHRTSELEKTIKNLKKTQKRLVEAEKMASLGELVAGVAHEINTPIGIGLTGITHLLDLTQDIRKTYEDDNMSVEEFENYLNTSEKVSKMINSNLSRTAALVNSFKQVSVDQVTEEKRIFNLKDYIDEILMSISNVTKKTKLDISVVCDKDIVISSFPGSFSQIITNLIINSIRHGFNEAEEGNISIQIEKNDNILTLIYKDDGHGIPKKNISKIFDPFFTTSRGKGGTGLGLNIIYNIVTSKLKGTLICNSVENKGVEFIIEVKVEEVKTK